MLIKPLLLLTLAFFSTKPAEVQKAPEPTVETGEQTASTDSKAIPLGALQAIYMCGFSDGQSVGKKVKKKKELNKSLSKWSNSDTCSLVRKGLWLEHTTEK